jgi:hypothetical protein
MREMMSHILFSSLSLTSLIPFRLEARQELRRQTGTLRFDLNTLAQTKAKEEKKKALELRKDFIAKVILFP